MEAPDWFVKGVIGHLSSAFPSWPCSENTIQTYWNVMSDMPGEQLCEAVIAYCRNETAWPTPAGVVRYAKLREESERMTASDAWEEMYRNRRVRHYPREVHWSSEAVRRAAEAVRWEDPEWLTEQIPTIRAQFERYYNAIEKKTRDFDLCSEASALLDAATSHMRLKAEGPTRLLE